MVQRLRLLFVLDRWTISAYLLSVLIGLVALSLAGRAVAHVNYIQGFVRFHRYLNPETLFYPTASQVVSLAKASARPDQIVVIVGGSSVLHGVGQATPEIWTGKLQELLGDQYKVLNFAFPAGAPEEHGAVAAQALTREGYKVVYITDARPGFIGLPDGLTNQYVFWDAYYKGYLEAYPERDARIKTQPQITQGEVTRLEYQMRSLLDSQLYFTDLWTTFGYTTLFTTWNYLVQPPVAYFTTPRKLLPDPSGAYVPPPTAERYPEANIPLEMSIVRGISQATCDPAAGRQLTEDARVSFPDSFRPKVVVSVTHNSKFFVERLTPEERACYDRGYALAVAALEQAGMHAKATGADYTADDFNDRTHLVASGAVKLAAEMAPLVQTVAREQRYLDR